MGEFEKQLMRLLEGAPHIGLETQQRAYSLLHRHRGTFFPDGKRFADQNVVPGDVTRTGVHLQRGSWLHTLCRCAPLSPDDEQGYFCEECLLQYRERSFRQLYERTVHRLKKGTFEPDNHLHLWSLYHVLACMPGVGIYATDDAYFFNTVSHYDRNMWVRLAGHGVHRRTSLWKQSAYCCGITAMHSERRYSEELDLSARETLLSDWDPDFVCAGCRDTAMEQWKNYMPFGVRTEGGRR